MTPLSPPLFLAAVYHLLDEVASRPNPAMRFGWRGECPADLALIHRIGIASHRDPVVHLSPWPLAQLTSVKALREFARRQCLTRAVARPGDFVAIADNDPFFPGVVAIVTRVLQYGVPSGQAPAECEVLFALPDDESAGWMQGVYIRRWCGPSRGDQVIRWADWEREVAA